MGDFEAVTVLKNDFEQRSIEEQIAFFKMMVPCMMQMFYIYFKIH
jgi:hypothetical protein